MAFRLRRSSGLARMQARAPQRSFGAGRRIGRARRHSRRLGRHARALRDRHYGQQPCGEPCVLRRAHGPSPQPPVRDELLGTVKHPFKHGSTTVNLWSFGAELPKDPRLAGIQYIVWNVAAIDAVVQQRGVAGRSAVIGARSDANAVAVGSRRRQQLLRGIQRQRQLTVLSIVDGQADVRAVLGADDVVMRRRGRQRQRRLAVGPQAVEIEIRIQRVELVVLAPLRLARVRGATYTYGRPTDRRRRARLRRGSAGSLLASRCQR